MQLPPNDKQAWQWSGGATAVLQHAASRFSLAVPGAPIVEHAGSTFGDIQWDLYVVTRVPHNIKLRLRHLALPADAVGELLAFLASQRTNGKLVAPAQPLADPAWGAETIAHGTLAMTLGRMGGAPGPGIRRDDDLLVLGRRDGGIVLVEVSVGERASPSSGAYLHAIHAGLRWNSGAPIVPPPPCAFLADGALPQLRAEALREIADLTPRLAAEPAALRASLLGPWEAMLRPEVRAPWSQPMAAPVLPPAYPQWLRDRLAAHGAYVRSARDLYGLMWIWVRALRAAEVPDDGAYFAAPGALELRPEREAELDAFAAELAAAGLPPRDNAALAKWIRVFSEAADDPAAPMIPQLADMMVMGAEQHTANKVALGKLGEHFGRLRVMRDLQALSIYWCAALARLVAA